MSSVLAVKFRDIEKIHYFVCYDSNIQKDDSIIAETKKGIECGKVLSLIEMSRDDERFGSTEKIIRKATKDDLESLELKKIEEKKAEKIFKKKVQEHKLNMKLVDVEYTFNRAKLIFYFISESRVDFRNLVKDLAYAFRVRIELRQVGTRDEAKLLGGLGICGRPLCCSTFLDDFQFVNVKMAKDQGISVSSSKLSGLCGRLKCCLKYEQDTYVELLEKIPKSGSLVKTPDGEGVVICGVPILSKVKVQVQDSANNPVIKTFNLRDISVIGKFENALNDE